MRANPRGNPASGTVVLIKPNVAPWHRAHRGHASRSSERDGGGPPTSLIRMHIRVRRARYTAMRRARYAAWRVPVASSVEYKREGRGGFWQSFSANTEFSTLDRETGMQIHMCPEIVEIVRPLSKTFLRDVINRRDSRLCKRSKRMSYM